MFCNAGKMRTVLDGQKFLSFLRQTVIVKPDDQSLDFKRF